MEWRVHIGAHKTATTHLQDSLSLAASQLRDFGICFIPREQSRPMLARGRDLARKPRRNHLNLYYLRRKLIRRAHGCDCLVISEENILGSTADCLRSRPYPGAESAITLLKNLKKKDKLTLFLSIRGFDEVASGAYATALRFKAVVPEDKEKFIAHVKRQPPRWAHLIERLIKSAPSNVDLKVWKHEDYINKREAVLTSLVYNAASIVPNIPPPKQTVTPSNQAISAAERLYDTPMPDYLSWKRKVDEIYHHHPVNSESEKFNFLDPETTEILKAAYKADCMEILDRWPDITLGLPWSSS